MQDNSIPLAKNLVIQLDAMIRELDVTQRSMDHAQKILAVEAILEIVAGQIFDVSDVMEVFERTDELPEEIRERIFLLLRGIHHMLLVLRPHCRA